MAFFDISAISVILRCLGQNPVLESDKYQEYRKMTEMIKNPIFS